MSHTPAENALFEMNRLLAEYRRLEDILEQDKKAEEVETMRIHDRAADIRHPVESQLQYVTGQLQELSKVEGVITGKAKSRAMANGTVSWRKAPDKIQVDATALEEAFKGDPSLRPLLAIKVSVTPDKKAIMAAVQDGGELPPGCDYQEGEDRFYVLADRTRPPTRQLLSTAEEMIGGGHGTRMASAPELQEGNMI